MSERRFGIIATKAITDIDIIAIQTSLKVTPAAMNHKQRDIIKSSTALLLPAKKIYHKHFNFNKFRWAGENYNPNNVCKHAAGNNPIETFADSDGEKSETVLRNVRFTNDHYIPFNNRKNPNNKFGTDKKATHRALRRWPEIKNKWVK